MLTAIVSDLHLGIASGTDIARRPEVRDRLVEALAGAERIVLLGDTLELRERPVGHVLERAEPVLRAVGQATAGRQVVIVPGNHDHQLVEPWIRRAELSGEALGLDTQWPVDDGDGLAGRLASWMPRADVRLAYPGLWLRPDVYATHGHYLDVHLSVPVLECIAASAMARVTGHRRSCRSPAEYEAVLAPIYAFFYNLVQGGTSGPLRAGNTVSRDVWSRARGDGSGGRLSQVLLGKVAIPSGVAVLNRVGLGPFSAELAPDDLRRAGLRAMGAVVESLGVRADHVVFGHTHRAGPALDEADWWGPNGTRLWNTGSWRLEPVFVGHPGATHSPYWPGTVLRIADDGSPEAVNVLRDVPLRPLPD